MRSKDRSCVNRHLTGALAALGAAVVMAGCSVPGTPGKTPANAVVGFGLLGELPYRQLDPVSLQPPRFPARIIAHRGYSARFPENTLSAIRGAVDAGADMVEIDVQLTKDNHLVVMHDDSVYRTTNGSGLVKNLTFDELRQLDAGSKFDPKFAGERVPTLEEALDAVHGKAMLNIEVKNIEQAGAQTLVVQTIAELLERKQYAAHVQIMSFDADFMKEMREKCPQVSMALLAISNPFNFKLREAIKLKMDGLNLFYKAATTDEVDDIQKAGLKTHVYTVNRSSTMLKALRRGADGLITDYPDIASAAMETHFRGATLPPNLDVAEDGE